MSDAAANQGSDSPPSQPVTMLAAVFALEVFGLIGFGIWGWSLGEGGITGAIATIVMIAIAATAWGVFRVRNDPPGKKPLVLVPGWLRLLIELSFYCLAAAGLWLSGSRAASETLMTGVAIVYLVM